MTLKNGQTHFKNLTLWTTQNFQSMFGHFSTPRMKGLKTLPLLRVHLFSTEANFPENLTFLTP